jgi:hypothetical protein
MTSQVDMRRFGCPNAGRLPGRVKGTRASAMISMR